MMDRHKGLYVLAAKDIFAMLADPHHADLEAHVSFYEIYQSQLYDLLNNRTRVHAREDGKQQVQIRGLNEHPVHNVAELMAIFEAGSTVRSTGTSFYFLL